MIQLRTNSKNKERSNCRIIIKQKSFLLILQKYQSTFIVSCAVYWSDNDYVKTLESAGKKVCYLKSVFLFRKKKNKKFSNSDLKTKSCQFQTWPTPLPSLLCEVWFLFSRWWLEAVEIVIDFWRGGRDVDDDVNRDEGPKVIMPRSWLWLVKDVFMLNWKRLLSEKKCQHGLVNIFRKIRKK